MAEEDLSTLSGRLKSARATLGITQPELARRARLKGQSLIGNLEAGLRRSSKYLPRIAEVLGVETLWLAEGKGPRFASGLRTGEPHESSYSSSAAPEMSVREQALLSLFNGLTEAQKDDFFRRLQDQKQQNDDLLNELLKQRRTG